MSACERPNCGLHVTGSDEPFCSTECNVEWSSHGRAAESNGMAPE